MTRTRALIATLALTLATTAACSNTDDRPRPGHWFTPLARKPPSTTSTSPVTKLAASEAR